MRMDETSTPKLRKHNFERKAMYYKKDVCIDRSFETNLKNLLNRELLNPREQIVDEIGRAHV